MTKVIKAWYSGAMVLSSILILIMIISLDASAALIVSFPDPNLEAAIREALGKPEGPITDVDLSGLTVLDAQDKAISDISGIEYCLNLTELILNENQIVDINPLSNLTNLRELEIRVNQISNIEPLSGLTNLGWVDLGNNEIGNNIHPVVNLTNLEGLSLWGNEISDISPLSNMTHLRWGLWLSHNEINDLTPLSNLINLEFLGLKENQITDISPLRNLTKLKALWLEQNQISDISPLSAMTDLRILYLDQNEIDDILPLAGLNMIGEVEPGEWWTKEREGIEVHLGFSYNQVSDISPLIYNSGIGNGDWVDLRGYPLDHESYVSHIPELRGRGVGLLFDTVVDIPDPNLEAAMRDALGKPEGPITDAELAILTEIDAPERGINYLSGIEYCTNLSVLDLRRNNIADISPLTGLSSLKWLNLENNQISDISPLRDLTGLSWLNLDGNQISDISPLRNLTNLKGLELRQNQIADITPLANLLDLRSLHLGSNGQISDVSPLIMLTQLEDLALSGNRIIDIKPLSGMIHLKELWLGGNENSKISDISPLSEMIHMQDLWLNNNQITNLEPLRDMIDLRILDLQANRVRDISPLSKLVDLQVLRLKYNDVSDISALANLTDLRVLYLDDNLISDISSLAGMTMMGEWEKGENDWWLEERDGVDIYLGLSQSPISEIMPLVSNLGIGEGDGVDLRFNPLNYAAYENHIPTLQARGVNLLFHPTVDIPDHNLEAAMLDALNRAEGPVNEEELANLWSLDASSRGISDLAGIEYCANLESLRLNDNQISNIEKLANLIDLSDLHLYDNQISDLSPLRSLTALQYLWLWNNQISDISPLSGLIDLRGLHLMGNPVTDINPLRDLINLEHLWLWNLNIDDISILAGFTNMQALAVAGTQINDMSPLANLTSLQALWAGNTPISDISPLAGLTELQALHLDHTNIADISPLSGLRKLGERSGGWVEWWFEEQDGIEICLELSGNQISDISPLANNPGIGDGDGVNLKGNPINYNAYDSHIPALQSRGVNVLFDQRVIFPDPNLEAAIREALNRPEGPINSGDLEDLTYFNASGRRISDITGIEYCINLDQLNLDQNQISDISSLRSLVSLSWLTLGQNQIDKLGALSDLTSLKTLWLSDNRISEVGALSKLTNLQNLYLGNNEISNITSLNELVELQELALATNQISDISSLEALTKLENLWLQHNQIEDIGYLRGMSNLKLLYIEGNLISDISSLDNMKGLQRLWAAGNRITDISPLSGMTGLQWLRLQHNQITDITPIAEMKDLRLLYLDNNGIDDISPLSAMTKIGEVVEEGWWIEDEIRDGIRISLGLSNNSISDIYPIVDNPGIGDSDGVDLRGNQLSYEAYNTHVPALQARGANLLFDELGTFSGVVRDMDTSQSIPATLILVDEKSVETDSEGKYQLTLRAGDYTITASRDKYIQQERTVTVDWGETIALDFALEVMQGGIKGTVTDADTGEPVSGAEISVNGNTAETNSLGKYQFALKPGDYSVTVIADDYVQQREAVMVNPDETATLDFGLELKDGIISGTVSDADTGIPISSATILIDGNTIRTGSDGKYQFTLKPGSYSVTVSADKYIQQEAEVAVKPDQTTVLDFRLEVKNGILASTVTDADTGDPISGVLVEVDSSSATTDMAGICKLALKPGNYTVTVSADKYIQQEQETTINPDETTSLNFQLQLMNGILSGIVINADTGEPLAGAGVEVKTLAGDTPQMETDPQGGFEFSLRPGICNVSISVDGYLIDGEQVEIEPDETVELTISAMPAVEVWPGDADNGGQVSILDIRPIGMFWGRQGDRRVPQSTSWAPGLTPTRNWHPVEAAYADTDGNGVVGEDDLLVIAENWQKVRPGVVPVIVAPTQLLADRDMLDIYRRMYSALDEQLTSGRLQNAENAMVLRDILGMLIAELKPKRTLLLANYPNPFNPDTWIPYQLSDDSSVEIRIYTSTGQHIRTMSLGHKLAGFYTSRQKAAYWDGRNEAGESVASGVYFYSIRAGDYTTIRKMTVTR